MTQPELYLSHHLLRRMHQRHVSREEVEVTVYHPHDVTDTVAPDTGEPSLRYSRTMYDGRTLKVWIVPPAPGAPWIVKSTAWKGIDDDG